MNPHLLDHLNSYRFDELRREARTQAAISRMKQSAREKPAGSAIRRLASLVFASPIFSGGRGGASAGNDRRRACGCAAGA